MTKYIKRMCADAEGFEYYTHEENEEIEYKTHFGCYADDLNDEKWLKKYGGRWTDVYYPLLLQRAFRTVAKKETLLDDISLMRIFKEGDKEIEQYLEYIYEQEGTIETN